jgi:aspartate-semialdehyde dehydrogenase
LPKSATVALIGGDSLMGREIRDVFAATSPGVNLRLIAADDEETGALTEHAGEATFLAGLDASNLEDATAVFLAASVESTRQAMKLAPGSGLIDLTYAAEDYPTARLRAPMVEPKGYKTPHGAIHVIANAAAIAVTLVLNRLHPVHIVRRSLMHVFEPASERGRRGLDELQQQTVSLLAFKGMPKKVYDAQLAFNLLARYGEEAPIALEESELRMERHLATLLSNSSQAPMPSLRLVQAPVFHGYTISLWVEFESNPGVGSIESALDAEPIDLRVSDAEPPNIVGAAGQSGIAVGGVALDRNHTQACWLWIALDNLRLQAENAAAVARELV